MTEKPTVVQQHEENLETLRLAFLNGDVSLMECTLKTTGEKVAVICAHTIEEREHRFIPFAMFFNGDPYELLEPPK